MSKTMVLKVDGWDGMNESPGGVKHRAPFYTENGITDAYSTAADKLNERLMVVPIVVQSTMSGNTGLQFPS